MEINVLKYELEGCGGRLLVQFLFNESKWVHGEQRKEMQFQTVANCFLNPFLVTLIQHQSPCTRFDSLKRN